MARSQQQKRDRSNQTMVENVWLWSNDQWPGSQEMTRSPFGQISEGGQIRERASSAGLTLVD